MAEINPWSCGIGGYAGPKERIHDAAGAAEMRDVPAEASAARRAIAVKRAVGERQAIANAPTVAIASPTGNLISGHSAIDQPGAGSFIHYTSAIGVATGAICPSRAAGSRISREGTARKAEGSGVI